MDSPISTRAIYRLWFTILQAVLLLFDYMDGSPQFRSALTIAHDYG